MPKELKDIKTFMKYAKGSDKESKDKNAPKRTVYVKHGKTLTKFKLRYSRYLYTFKTEKKEVAKKIMDSFASNNIQKVEIKGKKIQKKRAEKK